MRILYASLVLLMFLQSCKKHDVKQFSLLLADETGIEFSNDLIETDSLNYFTYPYMYMGGGVSAGDINNDGLVDLFFTANMKSNTLYLNKGDFVFEDITEKAKIKGDDRWFTGTTMVDINNDGYLDIYVSVSGKGDKRNNLLYINNGDLTFTEQAKKYGIDHKGHTTQSTFFDYDNDGDLDLYLANYPPTPFKSPVAFYKYKVHNPKIEESDILFKNNGDGTFTDVTVDAGVLNFGLSLSATIADFNNDGWKDIYVSNDFDAPDFMYLNNKNGTFKEIAKNAVNHTAQYGMGSDIADYNNDNLHDIAQVDMTPEDNRRSKANMSSMNPVGFTKMINAGLHYQYMQNCLQLNRGNDTNGNPVFSEVSRIAGIATTDWSWSILFSDLDNDGWKDITISNGTRRDINNRDYFLSLKSRNHFGGVKLSAEEIKQIPSEKISNYIFKNTKNHTFKNMVKEWGWEEKTFSNGVAYADLDNDGDLDFIINNIDHKASVYRNNNLNNNNFLQVTFKGSKNNKNGIGAKVYVTSSDLQQFGELTLSRGFQSSVAPRLHFGLGKTETVSNIKVVWPDGLVSELRDVKANQNLVIDYTSAKKINQHKKVNTTIFKTLDLDTLQVDFKHTENKYNDYYVEPLLPHQTSMLGSGVAVADVNGDGLDDFYIGGASKQAGALYIQNANGKFEKTNNDVWELDKNKEDMSALFFDADADGDNDLYVVSGGNEKYGDLLNFQDRLYINDGKGHFSKDVHRLPLIETSGSRVTAGDYDNDGDMDLFVGGRLVAGKYPWPTKSYILNNDKGVFKDVTKILAPDFNTLGMITDASWTDFDGNGTLDLIIVGEWTPILFYSNTDGTFKNVTDKTGLKNTSGWWSSITQDDFDNDGDMDYVVGNLGLNYKYKATAEEPFEVFADDFDGNNRKDIVLSYYNFGKLFPVRGKSCSTQQIPSLSKKFNKYDVFAEADVTEVYGKEQLEKAEIHYKAKTFASSYIENLGHGNFKLIKLPNEAQFSSVNKIITDDIDNDGFKDIVIAGNLYTSEIETPRNDSSIGNYLKGDGNGNFLSVPSAECGLSIRGDVKDLISININGHKHIIAAKNNDYPQFIKIN
ncbi:VCBS repeat-containing protein [Flavivirga abyssicola]|uniref:VCBS repeat-containing protein n=1 Tax=Flavivirga abyssicola TaxID=3063533 RepID=UPI0026DF16E8|nr:VCBS repeat-containing protein [Flavivirga sp. MEBiC07777]WVK13162.1 VCBS repeat-containing protein [Flavivirga sp. MEBiC07777]